MVESLRILILEDNPIDAELAQFELQEAGLTFSSETVIGEKDFIRELQEFSPDLILSDYDLPQYTGALALAEARRRCPEIPFILVTGAIGEDRAVEILTQGAKDYVFKNHLHRLAPAVRRALAEAGEHKARRKAEEELRKAHDDLQIEIQKKTEELQKEVAEHRKAEEDLRRSEAKYRIVADNTYSFEFWINPQGQHVYASPSCNRIMGYTSEDFIKDAGLRRKIVHPDDLGIFDRHVEEDENQRRDSEGEWRIIHADGSIRWISHICQPVYSDQEAYLGVRGSNRDVTTRKLAEERMYHMATHDGLTDLPTLRLALDRLSMALSEARRHKTMVAVMFIDLDGFKAVNDTLGHDAGDHVLKNVAQYLLSCVRETDTVSRVGGDEFLIIATGLHSSRNTALIAEKILQLVSKPVIFNERKVVVGTSIGIALYPDHGEDKDQLIKLADDAMYRIKNSGKNGYSFADPEKLPCRSSGWLQSTRVTILNNQSAAREKYESINP